MKKLTYLATALSALFFAASCQQQEMTEPVAQETTVSYTVELPGVETKAIGDGLNVDELVYEVWKTEKPDERDLTTEGKAIRLYQETAPMVVNGGVRSAIISLNLVQDQEYTILFWAQVEGTGVYDTDYLTDVHYAKAISGDADQLLSNQESYAAFYGIDFVSDEDAKSKKVTLKRPFAQLNLATKNTADEYTVEVLSSKVIVANVGTSFNVAQNYVANPEKNLAAQIAVGNAAEVTFDTATDPSGDDEKIVVNNQEYEYVAMNYLFATGNTVTVSYEIDANLTGTNGQTTSAKVTNTVLNVPLQENYRTNIVGNLLTSTTDYEVVVDASWDDVNDENLNGDGYVVEVWDGKYAQEPPMVDGVYQISLASELAWLSTAVNGTLPATKAETQPANNFKGKTFILKEDIDLDGARWIPIGASGKPFMGTFDGKGKTISNLTVATEGTASAGLFGATTSATIKNVTVVNANITGHYKTGVIVGDGLCAKIENCHVDGATVTVTPFEKDDANNVGGIVGYLSAERTASVENCSVKNATITAYRKVGGLVGAANGPAEVTGNTVENVTVTADQTAEYKEVKAAEAGQVVGFKHADANVANNTIVLTEDGKSQTVEVLVLIDDVAEIAGAATGDKAAVELKAGEYEFEESVTVNGALEVTAGNEVVLNANDQEIVSGTPADYGFRVIGEGASLVINEATIDSKGGAIGADAGAKVTVNSGSIAVNTSSTSGRYNVFAVGEGTEITINGGEFAFSKTLNQKRAYIYCGAGATVYVNGGTFGKASKRTGYTAGILGDGTVIITGGTFGFDPTQWLEYGYVAVKNGENWIVRAPAATVEEFEDAIKNAKAGDVIYVTGNGTLPSSIVTSTPGILTIEGVSEDSYVSFNSKAGGADGGLNCYADGMDLIFRNIKIVSPNTGSAYSGGFGRAKSVTFENCVYEGQYRAVNAYTKFEECTIDPKTSYIYTDYANVDFVDCIFNCSEGKGIQVYNDGTTSETTVNVTGCQFFAAKPGATWDEKPVTAIDINSNGEKFLVNISNTTDEGFPTGLVSGETLFNIKGGAENITINVDGKRFVSAGVWIDAEGNYIVTSAAGLTYVAANASVGTTNVIIANDIDGDVTVSQKPDVKLVIDGNDKNFDGMITVDGKSATYTTAGLTIKDLNFAATSISADACINLGKKSDNNTRYTCNVTVDNCTFDVPGAVGVKSYTGGDKNLTITGCKATTNAHSLVQAKGIDGILIEKCNVYSKNGLNFNNSDNVTVDNCTADVKGYAVRFGESSGGVGAAETYTIKNSTLKSACEGGDAVIILRGTADYSTLTITNTSLVGTTPITNTATEAKVIVDGGEYVADGVTMENDAYCVSKAAGLFWFANEVNSNGNKFSGKTVKLTADIDLENAAWTPVGQTGATQFQGTFDGQDKTISNLNVDAIAQIGGNYSSGLFGWLNAATVKNVKVDRATVKGNHNVGVIGGYLETAGCTIDNCHVTNAAVECHVANIEANGDKCGVIVGHAGNTGVVVKGCTAADCTVSAGRDAGQIVGAAKEVNVTSCSATNVTVAANGEGTGANIRNEVIGRIL